MAAGRAQPQPQPQTHRLSGTDTHTAGGRCDWWPAAALPPTLVLGPYYFKTGAIGRLQSREGEHQSLLTLYYFFLVVRIQQQELTCFFKGIAWPNVPPQTQFTAGTLIW